MKLRPTIKDVARMAGVSVGTVSRVINGNTSVTREKRRAVDHAVKLLGFVPSPVARSLVGMTDQATDRKPLPADAPCLTVVGQIVINQLVHVDSLPPGGSDVGALIRQSLGGQAAEVVIAASRQAAKFPCLVRLASSIGSDFESQWALDQLSNFGISTDAVQRADGRRLPRSVTIIDGIGQRAILEELTELPPPSLQEVLRSLSGESNRRCIHLDATMAGSVDDLPGKSSHNCLITIDAGSIAGDCVMPVAGSKWLGVSDVIFLRIPQVSEQAGHRSQAPALISELSERLAVSDADIVVWLEGEGLALLRSMHPPTFAAISLKRLSDRTIDPYAAAIGHFLSVFARTGDPLVAMRSVAMDAGAADDPAGAVRCSAV